MRRTVQPLVDRVFECGLALLRGVLDDAVDFLVGHEHALRADHARSAGRAVEHVALAEQSLGAVFIEDDAANRAGWRPGRRCGTGRWP